MYIYIYIYIYRERERESNPAASTDFLWLFIRPYNSSFPTSPPDCILCPQSAVLYKFLLVNQQWHVHIKGYIEERHLLFYHSFPRKCRTYLVQLTWLNLAIGGKFCFMWYWLIYIYIYTPTHKHIYIRPYIYIYIYIYIWNLDNGKTNESCKDTEFHVSISNKVINNHWLYFSGYI